MTGLDSFPTNRYLPLGSLVIKLGCAPVLNCEFEISASEPVLPIEYAKRFPEDWSFATYKYFPELSISKAVGPVSVCPIGEPGNAVSDPSALILNSEMDLSILFAVYR